MRSVVADSETLLAEPEPGPERKSERKSERVPQQRTVIRDAGRITASLPDRSRGIETVSFAHVGDVQFLAIDEQDENKGEHV